MHRIKTPLIAGHLRRWRASSTLQQWDVALGTRVRECRTLFDLSQHRLAEALGVSGQQVFKYERGESSISAGTLFEIARTLGVAITYFYEGAENWEALPALSHQQRGVFELARLLDEIHDEKYLVALSRLTRALANWGKVELRAAKDTP
jgi:transcriptional regulator with XRE-family HTH domain